MTSKNLESAVIRPFHFVYMLASKSPGILQERVLHFHHPLHPPPLAGVPLQYQLTYLKPVAGGRYILTGSLCGVAAIWDCEDAGKQPALVTWTQMPGRVWSVEFASKHSDSTGYFIVNSSSSSSNDSLRFVDFV